MGADTKAIIRKGTTLKEIKDVLEKKYGNVIVHKTGSNYYFCLIFDIEKDRRSLSVFFSDLAKSDYHIDGVLLSLGYGIKAIEIMRLLLDEFGGYLNENDCADDSEFKLVNLPAFMEAKEFTKEDEFRNEIINKLGYDNLETTMLLFEKYKNIKIN